jgi:hypothetical protein
MFSYGEELTSLDRVVERKLYDLDREDVHEVTDGSDDGFLYARGFIVAMGKDFYGAVLANPSVAGDASFELLRAPARKALRRLAGAGLGHLAGDRVQPRGLELSWLFSAGECGRRRCRSRGDDGRVVARAARGADHGARGRAQSGDGG